MEGGFVGATSGKATSRKLTLIGLELEVKVKHWSKLDVVHALSHLSIWEAEAGAALGI